MSAGGTGKFLWNITKEVGRNCPNVQEDVELVQLGYKSRFATLAGTITPTFRKCIESIRLGAPCTGKDDDPLVRTIVAHESQSLLARYDCKVSVLKPGVPIYNDGKDHYYLMVVLNQWLQNAGVLKYPRLDLYPDCPTPLKTAARRELFMVAK